MTTDRLALFGNVESDVEYEERTRRFPSNLSVAHDEDILDLFGFDLEGEKDIVVISDRLRYGSAQHVESSHRGQIGAKGKVVFVRAGEARKHIAGLRFDLLVVTDEQLAVDNAVWERLKPGAEIAQWTSGWRISRYADKDDQAANVDAPSPVEAKSWILKDLAITPGESIHAVVDAPDMRKVPRILNFRDLSQSLFILNFRDLSAGLDLRRVTRRIGFNVAADHRPSLEKDGYEVTPISEGDRLAAFFATSERDRMASEDQQTRDAAGLDRNGWPKTAKPECDREIVERASDVIAGVYRGGDGATAIAMETDANLTIYAIHERQREASHQAKVLASIRDDFDNLPDAD